MMNFAVMLRSRPATPDSILMLLDERREAEEIAIELRRKGHPVEVRPVGHPAGMRGRTANSPPPTCD
jgi:hypothetical protein